MTNPPLVTKSLLSIMIAALCLVDLTGRLVEDVAQAQPATPRIALAGGERTPSASPVRLAQAPSLSINDYGLSVPQTKAEEPVAESTPKSAAAKPAPALVPVPVKPAVRLSQLVAQATGAAVIPAAEADPLPEKVTVETGKFAVVKTTDVKSIAVADPEVLDVVVLTSQLLLLTGKSPGTTQLIIRDADRLTEHIVTVEDVEKVSPAEVEKALGVPGVTVSIIRDSIILEGTVTDPAASDRAEQIAGLFAKDVVNFVTVEEPTGPVESPELAQQIADAIKLEDVEVRVANDSAILTGTVESEEQKAKAEQAAAIFVPNVISLLKPKPLTPEEIQQIIGDENVTVKVVRDYVVLEGTVDSDAEKEQAASVAQLSGMQVLNQLEVPSTEISDEALAEQVQQAIETPSVKVTAAGGKVLLSGTVSSDDEAKRILELAKLVTTEVSGVLDVADPPQVQVEVQILEINVDDLDQLGVTLPTDYVFGETTANSAMVRQTPLVANIDALVQENKGRILQKPNTTVLSGKTATFNVGGEVPVPLSNEATGGFVNKTVEFRPFGIMMEVTPTVDRQGNITMQLTTEVSSPDFTIAVNIDGALVPGFRSRKAETEVFVKDGETLVLAGLIDTETRKAVTKFPVLGDLPILGTLFRSTEYQDGKTELVILVTPRTI